MSIELMVRNGDSYREASPDEVAMASAAIVAKEIVGKQLSGPEGAHEYIRKALAGRDSECYAVLWMDGRHRILNFEILFTGTIDTVSTYTREIMRAGLRANASAAIVAHCHPGEPLETLKPSEEDIKSTAMVSTLLNAVEIKLYDHILVGKDDFVSFLKIGKMPAPMSIPRKFLDDGIEMFPAMDDDVKSKKLKAIGDGVSVITAGGNDIPEEVKEEVQALIEEMHGKLLKVRENYVAKKKGKLN